MLRFVSSPAGDDRFRVSALEEELDHLICSPTDYTKDLLSDRRAGLKSFGCVVRLPASTDCCGWGMDGSFRRSASFGTGIPESPIEEEASGDSARAAGTRLGHPVALAPAVRTVPAQQFDTARRTIPESTTDENAAPAAGPADESSLKGRPRCPSALRSQSG